jgi:hypothetical protein
MNYLQKEVLQQKILLYRIDLWSKFLSDELVLKFLSHLSTPRLIGEPGSMHQLHFELLNNGNNANFQLRFVT